MLAAYGVDVLDPRVSLRRVWVLLERLPPATRRIGEEWSTEAELLALLIDHVADLTYVVARGVAGDKSASRPRPLRRPSRRRDRLGARRQQLAPASDESGEVKTDTWTAAGELIASLPGVVVTRDG